MPGYSQLPSVVQGVVGQVADTPATRRALRRVTLRSDGTVSLRPLQVELARSLRAQGITPLADTIAGSDPVRVDVPSKYVDPYNSARTTSRRSWIGGGLITLGLIGFALLVSPRRPRTLRSAGIVAVLASAVVVIGFALLPAFARAASSDPAVEALALVLQGERKQVLLTVAPVAVVGLVLAVVGIVTGRGSRRGSRTDDF